MHWGDDEYLGFMDFCVLKIKEWQFYLKTPKLGTQKYSFYCVAGLNLD